jgi:pimeloyl-ACP methyl ester carboxylesterase
MRVVEHDLGGSGPALLLLHANGFHGRIFMPMVSVLEREAELAAVNSMLVPRGAPQVETLCKSYRCIALDLPGHGDAQPLSSGFNVDDLVSCVVAYVQAKGLTGGPRVVFPHVARRAGTGDAGREAAKCQPRDQVPAQSHLQDATA